LNQETKRLVEANEPIGEVLDDLRLLRNSIEHSPNVKIREDKGGYSNICIKYLDNEFSKNAIDPYTIILYKENVDANGHYKELKIYKQINVLYTIEEILKYIENEILNQNLEL